MGSVPVHRGPQTSTGPILTSRDCLEVSPGAGGSVIPHVSPVSTLSRHCLHLCQITLHLQVVCVSLECLCSSMCPQILRQATVRSHPVVSSLQHQP